MWSLIETKTDTETIAVKDTKTEKCMASDRHKDRHVNRRRYMDSYGERDRHVDRHMDSETARQRDSETERCMGCVYSVIRICGQALAGFMSGKIEKEQFSFSVSFFSSCLFSSYHYSRNGNGIS